MLHPLLPRPQHQLGLKREMSELQAVVEALNIEKSSLESQLTSVREQLNLSHQQQHSLMEEVSQAQRQLARVKRKMEEQEHLHKKEQGQIRLKCVHVHVSLHGYFMTPMQTSEGVVGCET